MKISLSRFFRQNIRWLAVSLLPLLLAGCRDPEAVVLWSPDGQLGIVLDGQKNAVVDGNGAITGQLGTPEEGPATWRAEAWMPDSRRVLAVRSVPAKNWEEYAPLLGEERAQAALRSVETMLNYVREYHGDWEKFGNDDPRMDDWSKRLGFAANYTLRSSDMLFVPPGVGITFSLLLERHAAEVTPLLQTEMIKEVRSRGIQIAELVLRDAASAGAAGERVLLRSADSIAWAEPSPDGRMVAYVAMEPVRPVLYLLALEGGGPPVRLDEGIAQAAWTPDGRTLVYQKTGVPFATVADQAQLGTLTRRQVRDEGGAILAEMPTSEDLAGLLFSKVHHRVACLPDGRILFASAEFSLPAIENAKRLTLFTLQLGETRVIKRIVRDGESGNLPDRFDRFAVSPDGRRVALPGADGEMAIIDVETGGMTRLQEAVARYREEAKYENQAEPPAPTWRGPNELCYLIAPGDPVGSPRRAEVVLQTLGGGRKVISKTWSDELTKGFLPRPKAE